MFNDININQLLLYIFLILLLYCIMYIFIYSNKKFTFMNNIDEDDIRTDIDNTIKNNFEDITYYTDEDGIDYYNELVSVNAYLRENQENLIQILKVMRKKNINNSLLINNLSTLYLKQYLEYMNKKNAVVQAQSIKYKDPYTNKYFQQYL
jgi:hypothetical protein